MIVAMGESASTMWRSFRLGKIGGDRYARNEQRIACGRAAMTDVPERIKQVLLIRRDLAMRRGKEVAQGAHASMGFLAERLLPSDAAPDAFTLTLSGVEQQWLAQGMAKICLKV